MNRLLFAACAALFLPAVAAAQDSDQDLAKKLSNPVASLISVPLQLNYDCCFGPDEGARYTLNIQPVVPLSLNDDWNLIIRTIIPITYQERTSPQAGAASGFGDVTQSFFFSPKATRNGLTWAVGPAFLYPTGEAELGAKTWAAGPTGLLLKQQGQTTYGVLANHLWSVADLGDNARPDISQTFLQPFLSWTNSEATTVGINAEAAYNWKSEQWTVPVNLSVSHLYKFGGQRVSIGGGLRVYAAREGSGPEWGLRLITTFLFPG